MGCFPSRIPQQYHPCILVGSVVYGKPVPDFNRRPIAFRIDTGEVEDGSTTEVEAGRGSIRRVEYLGRVKVPEEEQLCIVQLWLKTAMKEAGRSISDETIFEAVEAAIKENPTPPANLRTVELDIFRGYVINRLRGRPFVYRQPSSFP